MMHFLLLFLTATDFSSSLELGPRPPSYKHLHKSHAVTKALPNIHRSLDRGVSRRNIFIGATLFCLDSALPVHAENAAIVAQTAPQKLSFRTDEATGVQVTDIRVGSGSLVEPFSKINFHVTGRLLGKNGWIFENSQQDGDPYRLQLGTTSIVPGLEVGLLGMKEGGKRRIIVPSDQGYLNKQLGPIPRDFGNRQRLYTTVMNSVRVNRERNQLGSDLAGKVVFDVELLRIR